tara:strand:- start:114 stop:734 length:621 start_codon:yes stop_codon:yes gene_type:complete
MQEIEAKLFIKENYNVNSKTFSKLDCFHKLLLNFNKKYNLISKKTEVEIWNRHFLDSVQLIDLIDINLRPVIADFGTGAGFPGLVIKILDNNNKFHVKLFEKSPIKRRFLSIVKEELKLKIDIEGNVYRNDKYIQADYVICRAFKKLDEIIKISRENVKKPHKLIVLKGKNAQNEINDVSLDKKYSYILIDSVTSKDSKILVVSAK